MFTEPDLSQLKLFIEHASGIERGALHVLLGVVVQFAAALLLRVPVTGFAPWLIVLCLELGNEFLEFRTDRWSDPGMQYGEAAKDVLLTMLLPTLIMAAARLYPSLFAAGLDRRRP